MLHKMALMWGEIMAFSKWQPVVTCINLLNSWGCSGCWQTDADHCFPLQNTVHIWRHLMPPWTGALFFIGRFQNTVMKRPKWFQTEVLPWTVWGDINSSKYKRLKEMAFLDTPVKPVTAQQNCWKGRTTKILIIRITIYFSFSDAVSYECMF